MMNLIINFAASYLHVAGDHEKTEYNIYSSGNCLNCMNFLWTTWYPFNIATICFLYVLYFLRNSDFVAGKAVELSVCGFWKRMKLYFILKGFVDKCILLNATWLFYLKCLLSTLLKFSVTAKCSFNDFIAILESVFYLHLVSGELLNW